MARMATTATDPAERPWRRLIARLKAAAKAAPRERAIIFGVAAAVGEAWLNGEVTKATAVPVIAGIVLRFLVSPYDSPKRARRRAEVEDGIRRPLLGRRRPSANFADSRPGGRADV